MKTLLSVASVLLFAIALAAFGQTTTRLRTVDWNAQEPDRDRGRASRMSPDDQQRFDHYYQKWVNDTRRNDRDDIRSDEQHMQEIMARYGIPSEVPYDRVASRGEGYGRDRDDHDRDRDRDGRGPRLSPDDQQRFDDLYAKWMNDSRRNDRDDIRDDERRMRDIMVRNNISPEVPFEVVASQGRR